jgi:lipopolysaccharide biosynthesis glycosyltransferase
LFITDKKTLPEIKKSKELKHFNVDYMVLPPTNDPVEASFQKLKIYDYKKIDNYSKILFLDLDILVVGDLSMIFEERTRPNIFYSGSHRLVQAHHKTVYHRLIDYSQAELDRMEKNGIFAFNAGQFFFKNTTTMRKHFENINGFISRWKGEYFFEQSFINCYFNVLSISNVFKFKEQFGFVSINQNEFDAKFGPETVFVHFMGSAGDGQDKLSFINAYYSHLI